MSNQIVKTILTGALSLGMIIPTGAAGYKVLAAKISETPEVPKVTSPSATPAADVAEGNEGNEANDQTTFNDDVVEELAVTPDPTIAPVIPVVPAIPVLPASSVLPAASSTPKSSAFPVASIKPGTAGKEIEIEDKEDDEVRFEKHETREDEIDD